MGPVGPSATVIPIPVSCCLYRGPLRCHQLAVSVSRPPPVSPFPCLSILRSSDPSSFDTIAFARLFALSFHFFSFLFLSFVFVLIKIFPLDQEITRMMLGKGGGGSGVGPWASEGSCTMSCTRALPPSMAKRQDGLCLRSLAAVRSWRSPHVVYVLYGGPRGLWRTRSPAQPRSATAWVAIGTGGARPGYTQHPRRQMCGPCRAVPRPPPCLSLARAKR